MRPWPASDDRHVYALPPISPSAATAPVNSLHPSVTSAASALACPARAGGRDVLRRHGAVHRKARAGHLVPAVSLAPSKSAAWRHWAVGQSNGCCQLHRLQFLNHRQCSECQGSARADGWQRLSYTAFGSPQQPRRCKSSSPIPNISVPRSGWRPTSHRTWITSHVLPFGGPSAGRTRRIGCRLACTLPVKRLPRFYCRLFLVVEFDGEHASGGMP